MSRPNAILVFDVDGVVLDERMFWDTAVETALTSRQLTGCDADQLSGVGIELGIQRVAKTRGCNSNVDLAAVLTAALEDDAVRQMLVADDGDPRTVVTRWIAVAESAYRAEAAAYADPLAGFGIDRTGVWFRGIATLFDAILQRRAQASATGLSRFREPLDDINTAFTTLTAAGLTCTACTGRSTAEARGALSQLVGVDARASVRDDVAWAESRSGARVLGKPHWYPLLCALVGRESALEWVAGGGAADGRRVIYVGDAVADYTMAQAARDLGWQVSFVHVRSGVTAPWQDEDIARADITLASVDRFSAVPAAVLREVPA